MPARGSGSGVRDGIPIYVLGRKGDLQLLEDSLRMRTGQGSPLQFSPELTQLIHSRHLRTAQRNLRPSASPPRNDLPSEVQVYLR